MMAAPYRSGRRVEGGAGQESTVTSAVDPQVSWTGYSLLDQVLGHRFKILKGRGRFSRRAAWCQAWPNSPPPRMLADT